MDFEKAYKTIIARIIERGGLDEIDEILLFYGHEKVIKTIRDEIYYLPNYAIDRALKFFPELQKEEMYCYLNRKDKPYHWDIVLLLNSFYFYFFQRNNKKKTKI